MAFALALFVRCIANKLKNLTGLSTRAGGFVCLVLVYFCCVVALFVISRLLIGQLGDFFKLLPDIYSEKIQPQLNKIISKQFSLALSEFTKDISTKVLSAVAQTVWEIPQMVFSVFVCVLASFFICFDYQNIKKVVILKLSSSKMKKLKAIKSAVKNTLFKMLYCYGILFVVTLVTLFIGFVLLNIKHAFGFSFIIALADLLPMLGVGTALIPWAIVCIVGGNIPLGVGLISLFLIISILRNILEPRIIGKKMGIHPLISLFVVYVGICFGGIFDAIFLLFIINVMKYIKGEII